MTNIPKTKLGKTSTDYYINHFIWLSSWRFRSPHNCPYTNFSPVIIVQSLCAKMGKTTIARFIGKKARHWTPRSKENLTMFDISIVALNIMIYERVKILPAVFHKLLGHIKLSIICTLCIMFTHVPIFQDIIHEK